jgi:hypothetical protein
MVEFVAIRSFEVIYQNKCLERIMSDIDKLKAIKTYHSIITSNHSCSFVDSIIISEY